MGLSVWEILILLLIVAIIFGAGKLPQIMGDLGKGIRSFKAGLNEGEAPAAATTGSDAHHTPTHPTEAAKRTEAGA